MAQNKEIKVKQVCPKKKILVCEDWPCSVPDAAILKTVVKKLILVSHFFRSDKRIKQNGIRNGLRICDLLL